MADINYGILQPAEQMAPIRTSAPQANSSSPQMAQGGDPFAGQKIGLERQQMQNEQLYRQGLLGNDQARLQMEKEKQAQDIAAQKLQMVGQQSTNQELAVKAQQAQQEQQFRTQDLQAYKKGGINAYTTSLESHDPAGAATLRQSQETTKEQIRKDGVASVSDTANLWHTIVPPNYNESDPKQQAQLMDNYQKNKALLKRLDPAVEETLGKNPTPSMVAHYAMGTVSTVYGYKQQMGMQGDIYKQTMINENKPTPLHQAQKDVTQAEEKLNDAKQTGNPVDIQKAQSELDQAKRAVQGELSGKSAMTQLGNGLIGSLGSVGNDINNFANNIDNVPNNIKNAPTTLNNIGQPSQADLEYTAQKYNLTIDQVKTKLGIK